MGGGPNAFSNIGENETMKVVAQFGFERINGRPKWQVEHVTLNALQEAREYIKHTYNNGWSLPPMPA